MDYRKSLFQIEQWSPKLARRIWGLTSLSQVPLVVALGIKVNRLSDLDVEIQIGLNKFTKNELGQMHPSVLLAAGEFASKLLWRRHIRENLEVISLNAIHGRFFKPCISVVKVRTELPEMERERALRKARSGEKVEFEMSLIYLDKKEQHVASVNCIWSINPLKTQSLSAREEVLHDPS
jgi:hypothetical protein